MIQQDGDLLPKIVNETTSPTSSPYRSDSRCASEPYHEIDVTLSTLLALFIYTVSLTTLSTALAKYPTLFVFSPAMLILPFFVM